MQLAKVPPAYDPAQLEMKAITRIGEAGPLSSSGTLRESQKMWYTSRPAPYASLVPVAQDTLITSRILSRSESNTSTFPLLLDRELSGHHKQSLSHAQQ